MKRRVGTRLLRGVPLLLAMSWAGCYAQHTADEELLDIGFPNEAYPDAGAPASDAGAVHADAGAACTQTDPIQLLVCQFTAGNTGTGGVRRDGGIRLSPTDLLQLQDLLDQLTAGQPGGGNLDVLDLLDLLGGLQGGGELDPQDLLNRLGSARRDAGAQPPTSTTTVTAKQCATATDLQTIVQCVLNGFQTPAGRPRQLL